MTCIAALTDGKIVWIGGDSAGVAGLSLEVRDDEKVFTRKDENGISWAFGFTSSFRMGQLIRYELKLPETTKNFEADPLRFMVAKFIPALRKCLADGGWQTKRDNHEIGGKFIVGILGHIFTVDSDHQVGVPHHNFTAAGCGEDLALGSLYATRPEIMNMSPQDRILTALEAAEWFSAGVRRPFHVVHTTG